MTLTTSDPAAAAEPGARRTSPRRGWAWTGAAAGLAGVVGIQASLAVDAAYDLDYAGDAARMTERLGDTVPQLLTLHFAMMAAGLLLLVFAAGLRRRLQMQAPAGSILADVAAAGLWLTSVTTILGVGFTTETVFGVTAGEDMPELDKEFGSVVSHWIGTIPWLWVGAGVTGVALAIAALRHASAPRWIGWASAVLGGITLLLGVSPLQYMAGFTGPVLLLVIGLGFALGDRVPRGERGLAGR